MPPKMTANPARPSRYRAGKATGVDSDSSSDEEDNNSGNEETQTKRKPTTTAAPVAPSKPSGPGRVVTHASLAKAISQQRGNGDDGDDAEAKRKARVALEAKAAQEGFVTESEEESEEDSEEDEDSDSSSDDDLQPRKFTLPKFMTKAQREAEAAKAKRIVGPQRRKPGEDDKEEEKKEEEPAEELDEEAARQKELDDMVVEQLQKQAAARITKKKQWEDSNESHAAAAVAMLNAGDAEEGVAPIVDFNADVDTEDDVDPEAEYAAWKLRELKRIKRQRERIEEKERELEELERRRNLTEEERQAEDEVKLAAQREEKEARGKMAYMQKYHHKGAFFQDAMAAEGLDKRDLMGARYVDEIQNRDLLPKALQIRDAAKLGKKGASKYRDLKSEDTGRWGSGLIDNDLNYNNNRYDSWGRERPGYSGDGGGGGGGGGGFGAFRRDDAEVNGANAIPLGPRKREEQPRTEEREIDQDRGDKVRGSDRDREPKERDHRDRDRERRRSRSPRRDRDRDSHRDSHRDRGRDRRDDYKDERRKRSPPSRDGRDRDRDRERHRDRDRERDRSIDRHGEKRRRIET